MFVLVGTAPREWHAPSSLGASTGSRVKQGEILERETRFQRNLGPHLSDSSFLSVSRQSEIRETLHGDEFRLIPSFRVRFKEHIGIA